MFTISENSGIKPTTKKGFYSGSKQMKKELGTRNSMKEFDTMITATTSNGGEPRFPRYTCARIIKLSNGEEFYMPI
jgi:hypothetical protein|tara:strand:+ start:384 stop:611 length:228 start_codon:yes stop_codon:yes gene_type:complete